MDNVQRDERAQGELVRMGWRVITIWECETKDQMRLKEQLSMQLDQ